MRVPKRICSLLVCLALTPHSGHADEAEDKARNALARLGRAFNAMTGRLDLFESAVTDADMESIARLPGLRFLNLNVTRVGDKTLDSLRNSRDLESLALAGTRVSDAGLKHVGGMARLHTLVLRNTAVSDAGLKHLSELTTLQVLHLEGSRVRGAGLKYLAGLTSLQSLDLSGTAVDDDALSHLKGLTALRSLNLTGARVSAAGLKHLRGLKELRYLLDVPAPPTTPEQEDALAALRGAGVRIESAPVRWRSMADFDERRPPHAGLVAGIGGRDIDRAALARLADLPQLQVVVVRSHAVQDADLAALKGLTGLEEIDLLCMSAIGDKGLEHLKGLTGLRRLILDGTSVTDAGLPHLHGLTRLELLRLGKHVSAAGARDLQKRLPKTRIVHFNGGP